MLDNKQNEKELMREMFVIKLKQMLEEKQRAATQEAAISQ